MPGGLDALTVFGLVSVGLCLVCYALETRSYWWTLGFAAACVASSVYGFLQGAWPFGLVEIAWTVIALWRFGVLRRAATRARPGPSSP